MIIAVLAHKTTWVDRLAFNWFDLVLVVMLAIGYIRGRKNGMSREVMIAPKWVVMVAVGGLGYTVLGDLLIQQGIIRSVFPGHMFKESTAAYVSAYLLLALVVAVIFSYVKKKYAEKIAGSSMFGSGEYYLGMLAGMVRYACMLIFFLALLNAPVYSAAEIYQRQAYENKWYGGGVQGYNGDFIPSINDIQDGVFKNSLLGPAIKKDLSMLLINTNGAGRSNPRGVHIGA